MYALTARAEDRGRRLRTVRPDLMSPDPARAALDKWIIFVHGFNRDYEDATRTWRRTAALLEGQRVDIRKVVLFYWPGDSLDPLVGDLLSPLHYPEAVHTAERAATLLAAYLDRTSLDRKPPTPPLSLSFIAHSLGALITLKTLRLLRERGSSVNVEHVLLMAAAVPEGYCVDGATFGEAFRPETRECVLHSKSDKVLRWFFEKGQRDADREPPERPEAVGFRGGPVLGPGRRWPESHETGLNHGDYWVSEKVMGEIARVITGSAK